MRIDCRPSEEYSASPYHGTELQFDGSNQAGMSLCALEAFCCYTVNLSVLAPVLRYTNIIQDDIRLSTQDTLVFIDKGISAIIFFGLTMAVRWALTNPICIFQVT